MAQKQKTKKKKDKEEDKSMGYSGAPICEGTDGKGGKNSQEEKVQYGNEAIHHIEEALSPTQGQSGPEGWCVYIITCKSCDGKCVGETKRPQCGNTEMKWRR